MVDWNKINPYSFERIIGDLYERLGYSVYVTKKSKDGGVDVFAKKYVAEFDRHFLCVIQAKKYARKKIGIAEVQRISGVIKSEHANLGVIITTSDFSDEAIREAMKQKNVELINKSVLERKLLEEGLIDVEDVCVSDSDEECSWMRLIVDLLKKEPFKCCLFSDLSKKAKAIDSRISERRLVKTIETLEKTHRVVLNSGKISLMPSISEKTKLPSEVKEVLSNLSFPFDMEFVKFYLSKQLNFDPDVVLINSNIPQLVSELLQDKHILLLDANKYVPISVINSIKKAEKKISDPKDICDLTSSFLVNSIKNAKKAYRQAFDNVIVSEKKVSENYNQIAHFFYLTDNVSLMISAYFEKFLLLNDQSILRITETLATMTEEHAISITKAKQMISTNFDINEQLLKTVIFQVCVNHRTYIPKSRLCIDEEEE